MSLLCTKYPAAGPTCFQSSSSHTISLRPILILSPVYAYVLMRLQIFIFIILISHMCAVYSAHLILLGFITQNMWCRVQIMKLIMEILLCLSLSLESKNVPENAVLKHRQFMFLNECMSQTKFRIHIHNR
jgi:hypothetical protein